MGEELGQVSEDLRAPRSQVALGNETPTPPASSRWSAAACPSASSTKWKTTSANGWPVLFQLSVFSVSAFLRTGLSPLQFVTRASFLLPTLAFESPASPSAALRLLSSCPPERFRASLPPRRRRHADGVSECYVTSCRSVRQGRTDLGRHMNVVHRTPEVGALRYTAQRT